jgi:hypothetical protein
MAIELSYEHFPKATEKTLDLIAKVGTQVGNGLDVTVKYIDDKTGNVSNFLSALASLMPFTILPAVPAGTITDNILPPPLI